MLYYTIHYIMLYYIILHYQIIATSTDTESYSHLGSEAPQIQVRQEGAA